MNEHSSIAKKLKDGMQQLGINASAESLLHYLQLLQKWNKAYNLTAIQDLSAMVTRHVLDSLAVVPWVKGTRVLDVGSGAGLPGIPLALVRPELEVVLLDSNGKKTRFLHEVKRVLSLHNVDIVQTRVESYHPAQGFDTVISRAFSDLQQMIKWTHHLVAEDGIWLAMKGRRPEAELTAIPYAYQVESYKIAGMDGERCCVIISK
ncbi:16S rRNA (guanine(527)-N(7))-methyltransferase RsmG [Legionella septentrionalis]|uniref:Ribosomal RNA small subunit methyltransferase G n=1 Tax=Legionella septentrionalis TaxID=2498109 RepID=A0A3S0VB00_9GAMM|nr:16S rRNA (guanine(527)-N(7))-methyltransferase RsmG [Legionella septentrionalis]RUQ88820.1 16S rRNA (guanine(527)-N(7))-methyltransferase RsmG [Legionella septentrionalis]